MAKSKNRNKRSTSSGNPKQTQQTSSTSSTPSGTTQGGTAPNPQGSGVPRSPSERALAPRSSTNTTSIASTSRSSERRKAREQERRRQRILMIGGIVGVIALLAVVAIIINTLPAEAPIPEGAVERYQDIPTSTTDQGYARLGDPQNTRVRVVEYASFSCPACLSFHEDGYDTLVGRVRAGDITYTFVPMGQFGGVGGVEAARAAQCVNEQGQFWPYHDMLFSWQSLYANQAFTLNRLRSGVENLGLNVDQYNACMNSGRPDAIVERGLAEGQNVPNFSGTPTFTINGVNLAWPFTDEQLNAAIDAAIANTGGVPGGNTDDTTATEEPVVTEETVVTDEATDEAVVTEEAPTEAMVTDETSDTAP
jgi:protein-disulfide isomerase